MITDSNQTFTIFTYNCFQLEWSGFTESDHAAVGFNAFGEKFENHYLSTRPEITMIACENHPCTEWSNLVYEISIPGFNDLRMKCLEKYYADFAFSIAPIVAQPCPCSGFQAWLDRRFVWINLNCYIHLLSSGYTQMCC